jgi:two-component system, OmpR family, sensor histidine kinase BaeS
MASGQVDALIHEMRNALAVARANLEGLVDGKLAPTPERLLGIIQALNQLDGLVEDLRVLGPEAEMVSHPVLINVCELLDREYAAVEALARAKDIRVSVRRCATQNPQCAQFMGDPVRIGQVVKNVLLNAIRYTPAGGSIAIDCGHPGDELEIRIADSGPGVKPQEAGAVFKTGYRGVAAAGKMGSGHGLAIVKQLVEEHGGSVSVACDDGAGATFTVKLPGTVPGDLQCEVCRRS